MHYKRKFNVKLVNPSINKRRFYFSHKMLCLITLNKYRETVEGEYF